MYFINMFIIWHVTHQINMFQHSEEKATDSIDTNVYSVVENRKSGKKVLSDPIYQ